MKCPICNGKGTQFIADYDGMYDIVCDKCKGKGELGENGKPILTNEEHIKSLNTERLAEYLASTFDLCGAGCHHCFLAKECLTKAKNGNCLTQEQMIVEWLKQPHSSK